ncbi:MAG: hypothetical protein QM713_03410 [Arachnia sp.]
MRRVLALLSAVVLAFGLSACKEGGEAVPARTPSAPVTIASVEPLGHPVESPLCPACTVRKKPAGSTTEP